MKPKNSKIIILVVLLLAVFYTGHVVIAACQGICNPAPGIFVDFTATGGQNTFKELAMRILNALLGIAGIVAVLFMIIGGFQYIVSRGNEEQAEAGKRTVSYAVLGVVIIVLSYVIVNVISTELLKL